MIFIEDSLIFNAMNLDCDRFKNKYRIKSARAEWHDYNEGVYFITICTKDRECFFGQISDGKMILSEIGRYAEEQLKTIPEHHPQTKILLWVIMPNHIHMIVEIDGYRNSTRKENINCKNQDIQEISNKQGLLSTAICGFKQSIKCFALSHQIRFDWQTRFHDHIIRNETAFERISEYIKNNVSKWSEDCFHP